MSVKNALRSLTKRANKLPQKTPPTKPFTDEERAAIRGGIQTMIAVYMELSDEELKEVTPVGNSIREQFLRRLCTIAYNRKQAEKRKQEREEEERRLREQLINEVNTGTDKDEDDVTSPIYKARIHAALQERGIIRKRKN